MGVVRDLIGMGKGGGKDGGGLSDIIQGAKNRKKRNNQGDSSHTMIGPDADVPSYKRGGKVRKTGLARLHKGEYVETTKEAKKRHGKRRGSKSR